MKHPAALSVLEELVSDEPLDARLADAREHIDTARSDARMDSALRYAVVAALSGELREAHVGVNFARDLGATSNETTIEDVAAFVALRTGDARRALAASRRAHPLGLDASSPAYGASSALRAQAQLLAGEAQEAESLVRACLEHSTAAEQMWLRVIVAESRLARGDLAGAQDELGQLAPSAGLLASRVSMVRGRALVTTDAAAARAALSLAVWRLVRLGAPRELGVAYLSMSEVEVASGGGRRAAADWLARAQPLLARAGTPHDVLRLRAAFRAWGRRAVDRAVDTEGGARMDALRVARDGLRDLAATLLDEHDAHTGGEEHSEGLSHQLDEAVTKLYQSSEAVVSDLERALVDRERVGQLIQAGRRLMPLEREEDVLDAIPALALALGVGDTAEVVERVAGEPLLVLASQGDPAVAARMRDEAEVSRVLESGDAHLFVQNLAVSPSAPGAPPPRPNVALVPLRNDRRELVLVVAVSAPAGFIREADFERLRLFVSLAATSLERARAAEALGLSAARDAATVEAIRDGVLTLDRRGRVSSLNHTGARLLGIRSESLIGTALGDVPAVAPLAALFERGGNVDDEIVSLPSLDLLVRVRLHAGGGVLSFTERARAERRAQRLVGSDARFDFSDIIGDDPRLQAAIRDARRAAQVDVPILITGESGTGKEVFAQAIHNASPRAHAPFVGVNVAAIPRELLESELFGYEPGAFTGARPGGHPGKFELAQDGTLLLDEIGEMSAELQAKLLRVLQEHKVQRLGGTRATPIRARVLATTHRDLEAAVEEGSFRLDLYYRLKVVHLDLPPLRERVGDVPLLIEHYLRQFALSSGRPRLRVDESVMRRFEAYVWPGNVRELANMVEAEASLSPPEATTLSAPPTALLRRLERHRSSAPPRSMLVQPELTAPVLPLAEVERHAFEHALASKKGNVAAAAKALGVSRATFYNKLRRYSLRRR